MVPTSAVRSEHRNQDVISSSHASVQNSVVFATRSHTHVFLFLCDFLPFLPVDFAEFGPETGSEASSRGLPSE